MSKQKLALAFGLTIGTAAGLASAQTIADAARKARSEKPATSSTKHVYTNDSISFRQDEKDSTATSDSTGKQSGQSSDEKKSTGEDKQKMAEEMKQKAQGLKNQIETLKREIENADRAQRQQASQYYADAGARLSNGRQWQQQQVQRQQEIENKKKQIADAQSQLDKLREQARRSGISGVN